MKKLFFISIDLIVVFFGFNFNQDEQYVSMGKDEAIFVLEIDAIASRLDINNPKDSCVVFEKISQKIKERKIYNLSFPEDTVVLFGQYLFEEKECLKKYGKQLKPRIKA